MGSREDDSDDNRPELVGGEDDSDYNDDAKEEHIFVYKINEQHQYQSIAYILKVSCLANQKMNRRLILMQYLNY
eukprot:4098454-Ditylum_brightwellii.AAC.1